jgi:hypothetical protein
VKKNKKKSQKNGPGLARAFDLARSKLALGQEEYVCFALERLYWDSEITTQVWEAAEKIIRKRLKGHITVIQWLQAGGKPFDENSYTGHLSDQVWVIQQGAKNGFQAKEWMTDYRSAFYYSPRDYILYRWELLQPAS